MKRTILLLILVLAFFLRFYKLDSYPALNADEAAIGYNAYSLLETGKDEHGTPWPVHFQSFNDYKPGLYVYMVMPFVKVLGLNEWSVRLPGASLGVLTVLVIYFLAKELRMIHQSPITNHYSLAAALLLAISPWHIHFSRGGWEVNIATFFITLGVLLLLKSFRNPKYYTFCALSFVLALYTYHSARVVVPFLLLGISILNFKSVLKNYKYVLAAALLGGFLLIPLARDLAGEAVLSRAAGVGLFADVGPLNRLNEQRGQHQDFTGIIAKVIHNKPANYALAFLQNWSEHYWGEFLFLSGDDIERNKVPETGQLHLIEAVFVFLGLAAIFRKSNNWGFVLIWLCAAPIAAALTFQSPHALRAHNMVIPLTLISAFGLVQILGHLLPARKLYALALAGGLITVIALSAMRYLHMYWTHMSKEYLFSSQYGVKELVQYLKINNDSNRVIVTDRYDQPYILFLFYLKYPPKVFQANHQLTPRDQFGFSTVREFDKYVFKQVDLEGDRLQYPNSLIVGTDEQIPNESNIVKHVYGSNGHLYFKVVRN